MCSRESRRRAGSRTEQKPESAPRRRPRCPGRRKYKNPLFPRLFATRLDGADEKADVSLPVCLPWRSVRCCLAWQSRPSPEHVGASRKAGGDGSETENQRKQQIPGCTCHFAVTRQSQGLKAKGGHGRVASKETGHGELPGSHRRKSPMAGRRCGQNADDEGAAHIDDQCSPGKCLAHAPRHETGEPESRDPAEHAAKRNPDCSIKCIHRTPRLLFALPGASDRALVSQLSLPSALKPRPPVGTPFLVGKRHSHLTSRRDGQGAGAGASPWLNPRILDTAGVISPYQAVLGNPFPLDKRILDDVKPGIHIDRRHPALLRRQHHSGGSTASSYSFLNRAINSEAGRILPTLPTPWPLPQISFQAFGLARSPDASVPKLIFDASASGRLSGSIPAATIDGFR